MNGRWFSSEAVADVAAGVNGNGIVDVPLAQTGEGIAECELLKWFVQEVCYSFYLLHKRILHNINTHAFVYIYIVDPRICARFVRFEWEVFAGLHIGGLHFAYNGSVI